MSAEMDDRGPCLVRTWSAPEAPTLFIKAVCGPLIDALKEVPVHVQDRSDAGVSEAASHDRWMLALFDELSTAMMRSKLTSKLVPRGILDE